MINNSVFSMGRIISTKYIGILNAGACIFGHFGDFRDGVESPGIRDRNIWECVEVERGLKHTGIILMDYYSITWLHT